MLATIAHRPLDALTKFLIHLLQTSARPVANLRVVARSGNAVPVVSRILGSRPLSAMMARRLVPGGQVGQIWAPSAARGFTKPSALLDQPPYWLSVGRWWAVG